MEHHIHFKGFAALSIGLVFTSGDLPKVTVLDANADIQAERETFSRAFDTLYRDILEYIPDAELEEVDSVNGMVHTSQGTFGGSVINVIPEQCAIGLVRKAGLTGADGRWAPVDPTTYVSLESDFQDVYVIGDSQFTSQPKSAHMANAQAKICADAIVRKLSNLPTGSLERLENITTNPACYSPITKNEASWLTANFALNMDDQEDQWEVDHKTRMRLTHIGEAEEWNSENYQDMFTWADNLFTDCFS